jgi:uncharacterized protein (DUF433 family)
LKPDLALIGIGLYTPSEAARLIGVPGQKLVRWLRGHSIGGRDYEPLWSPQVDLRDGSTYLGFLDLVQARLANAFIRSGLSPQKVRRAILLGRQILATNYPFASARFRTDGKTVILEVLTPGEDERLIDLFRSGQYLMKKIIEPSLKGVDFEHELAVRWWPVGKSMGIVVDPQRQFGQPIDNETGVPTSVLAQAAKTEGSIERAAEVYHVPIRSVRRAVAFEQRAD